MVTWICLQFVIVVFTSHTHLLSGLRSAVLSLCQISMTQTHVSVKSFIYQVVSINAMNQVISYWSIYRQK